MVLLKKNKILRDDNKVTTEFHSYFNSIVSSLAITENKYTIQKNIPSSEPIDKVIMKFHFHPNIPLIKMKVNSSNKQFFIHRKILKKLARSTAPVLQTLFIEILRAGNFPDKLKLANIALVSTKNNSLEKEN